MSNIYVGGISFDSGFSSGFQTTPLSISNVEIASTSASVTVTSGITVNVSETVIDIFQLDIVEIITDTGVNVNTSASLIDILSNDITEVSAGVNVNTSASLIDILSNDITEVSAGVNVNTSASEIDITSLLPNVNIDDNVLINVNSSLIDILSNDITEVLIGIGINANTSASIIDVLSNNIIEVFTTSNINTSSTPSIIEITPLDPALSVGISEIINVNQSLIDINTTSTLVNIGTGININTSSTDIDITPYNANVTTGQGIFASTSASDILITQNDITLKVDNNLAVNNTIININSLDVTVSVGIGLNINTNNSIIEIKPNNTIASIGAYAYPDTSIINVKSNNIILVAGAEILAEDSSIIVGILDVIPSIGVNVITDSTSIDITPNEAIASIGAYAYPVKTDINIKSLQPVEIQTGIGALVSESIINIRLRTVDGAGEKLPNWIDEECIDSSFWDVDSQCKENESNLFDNIVNNAFNMYGVDAVWYVVDYSLNNEKVYGEDNDRTVMRNFKVKYYLEDLNEAADRSQYNKWGIEGIDNFEIYISKVHFEQASQLNMNGNIASRPYIPKEGDIMRSEHLGVYYEVVELKDRTELFLQRSHSWTITLRPVTNKHYNYDPSLASDNIVTALKSSDDLGQNNLIDTKKDDVLYNDTINPNDDPFDLFG